MFIDRVVSRRWSPLAIAALGLVLFIPLLGSFGLWDPHEVRVADLAKELLGDNAANLTRPPLTLWLISLGFRTLGVGEIGGRLPMALASVLALLGCFYAGSALLRRRGAWLGTLILLSMPVFFLGARQLTSNVAVILATSLAVGGLARAVWPTAGQKIVWRFLHLIVGIFGLLLGYWACGFALGTMVPLVALASALLLAGGSALTTLLVTIVALAALVMVLSAWWQGVSPGHQAVYSPILGGTPRNSAWTVHLTSPLKQIGFGAYPWAALLPVAAAWSLTSPGQANEKSAEDARLRATRLFLLAWALIAYLGTILNFASVGETMYPGFLALALLAGDCLDQAFDDNRHLYYAGLVVFVGAVILGHDVFMAPESLCGAHLVEALKWPGPLKVAPYILLGIGLAWGVAVLLGFAWLPSDKTLRGRHGWLLGVLLIGLGQAFWVTYSIVPSLSQHLSSKGLFTKFRQLGGSNARIGQYRITGRGAAYYSEGKSTDLMSLSQVFDFLAVSERSFVIASPDELPAIDQYAKSHPTANGAPAIYYVVDDSNARALLLSNLLGLQEQDLNPLKRLVVDHLPRQPQHEVHIDFDGKAELVGYDLPPELERGSKFKITLYYKVNAPMPGGYKVFIHFDGPGNRFNGDHVPLEGKFPTGSWVPGFYVIDEHLMEPDRATTTSGQYQIYTGFWLGENRLKIVNGPNDGENRAKIGSVRVR